MIGLTVRTHRQYRARQIKLQDLYIRRGARFLRAQILLLSYFESETLAFCGVDNPFACSIRMRLTSWIVSGFP